MDGVTYEKVYKWGRFHMTVLTKWEGRKRGGRREGESND